MQLPDPMQLQSNPNLTCFTSDSESEARENKLLRGRTPTQRGSNRSAAGQSAVTQQRDPENFMTYIRYERPFFLPTSRGGASPHGRGPRGRKGYLGRPSEGVVLSSRNDSLPCQRILLPHPSPPPSSRLPVAATRPCVCGRAVHSYDRDHDPRFNRTHHVRFFSNMIFSFNYTCMIHSSIPSDRCQK